MLPDASVTARVITTGYTRTVIADSAGQFSILALPPGHYQLTAEVANFRKGIIDNVNLNVNDELHFDFTLQPGSVTQIVEVQAAALQVQSESTELGTTIQANQIQSMPLNGRSYLDLLSLQAGVAPTNTNSNFNDRSPASGLYSGSPSASGNVSTDGQPEYANAFLVNGAEVNETKNMGAGLIPNADSVAEFRLLTNSFSAEYGKFTGAVMNSVTKSGTNRFHGDVFEFYRNQGLDANSWFSPTKPELKRRPFGGVVGGPIWNGQAFLLLRLSANPPGCWPQHRRCAGDEQR